MLGSSRCCAPNQPNSPFPAFKVIHPGRAATVTVFQNLHAEFPCAVLLQYSPDPHLANEAERVPIVGNGEFYDFERQRRELEQRGHRFRTRSDSEIALHLYEDYGAHCVQHLRGEFAFVLWDENNQTLLAVRDRFGIKPLYYSVQGGTIYLASEIKALFAAGVTPGWDQEYFYQMATGPTMPDRTLFAGVHQVPPGHYLLATPNGMRLLPYWE